MCIPKRYILMFRNFFGKNSIAVWTKSSLVFITKRKRNARFVYLNFSGTGFLCVISGYVMVVILVPFSSSYPHRFAFFSLCHLYSFLHVVVMTIAQKRKCINALVHMSLMSIRLFGLILIHFVFELNQMNVSSI